MGARQRVALLGLLVFALLSGLRGPAKADGPLHPRLALVADHSDDPVLGIVGSGTVQFVETPAPSVPRECRPRYMAGPATGIVVAPGAVLGGAVMVAAGNFEVLGPRQKTTGDRALIAGGSIVIAAGIATLLFSIDRLIKNRHTRRRVCEPDTSEEEDSALPARG